MLDKIGPLELGIIFLIIVMIFGVGKLPQIGSDIGKSIRVFKKAQTDNDDEYEEVVVNPKRKTRKVAGRITQHAQE
jgi:sec-independent protein translocase protein TatA